MFKISAVRPLFCLSLALAAAGPAMAQQKLVPAESSEQFVSRQMKVPVEAHFRKFDAQIAFDPAKPDAAKIALTIDTV